MEVYKIQQFIESPEGFSQSDIDSLADLCIKFPYVSTFKQLHLIALKEIHSVQFSEYLSKTAAWIPSRKILKEIIDQKQKVNKQKPRFKEPINLEIIAVEEQKSFPINEPENSTFTKEKNHLSSSEIIDTQAKGSTDNKEIKTTQLEYEKNLTINPYFDKQNIIEEKKSDKKTFSDWLKASSSNQDLTEKQSENKKSLHQKIIDNFIEKQPKIGTVNIPESPVKNGAYENISMVDPEDYITETLAQVYEKQGNFSKAIASYGKLKLKYPEKSDYFATQLERLNQLKKNIE